ncbi:MAG: anthranilate synthase component I, partial [Myxococcota bacterium]
MNSILERELHADLDTPVSAYLKLAVDAKWSFLYESVEGAERWASYSIIGVGAKRSFIAAEGKLSVVKDGAQETLDAPDPLTALRDASAFVASESAGEDRPPFVGGIFGFLSYDAVRSFEPLGTPPGPAIAPDACFFEPELLAVFDNRRHRLVLYAHDTDTLDQAEQRMRAPVREPAAPSR